MKKLSKISESIWSDIQDRSSGEVTRKEDEMHDDDFKILMETAKMFKLTVRVCSDPSTPVVFHSFPDHYQYDDTCEDFVKYIKARKDEHFWKGVDDKTYDKIMNFVKKNWGDCKSINEFTAKYINLDESVWADIQDRSSGDVTRKEDDMNDEDFELLKSMANKFWISVEDNGDTVKIQFTDYKSKKSTTFRLANNLDGFLKYIKLRLFLKI